MEWETLGDLGIDRLLIHPHGWLVRGRRNSGGVEFVPDVGATWRVDASSWEALDGLDLERLRVTPLGWLVRDSRNAGGGVRFVSDADGAWNPSGQPDTREADTGAASKSAEGAFASAVRIAGREINSPDMAHIQNPAANVARFSKARR